MRARPDWRLALVAMAVALVTALAVLVAEEPPGPTASGVSLVAEDDGGDKSGEDKSSEDKSSEDQGGDSGDSGSGDKSGDDKTGDDKTGDDKGGSDKSGQDKTGDDKTGGDEKAGEFPGRDQIGRADAGEYVALDGVEPTGGRGQGGDFSGGSYSIKCTMSPHHNSDNFIIAPGVRNGAQHTHDYAGNQGTNAASNDDSLDEASTTCSNGDRSPIFWPVLRDLRGVGPDVGADGGSLDGNVGSFVTPTSVDYTFHGHGTRPAEPMPLNIALVTGSAKAATADGEGSNAKFTCAGSTDRMTDRYPICPGGRSLMRVFDFPSCWNGKDLDSEDHVSHIRYPDENGECADDETPVPALRITVAYDQPPGRSFAIDSFPEQRHDPITDHSLLEYLSTERRSQAGADCINDARRCVQDSAQNVTSTDRRDQLARSVTFAHALATHGNMHGGGVPHGSR